MEGTRMNFSSMEKYCKPIEIGIIKIIIHELKLLIAKSIIALILKSFMSFSNCDKSTNIKYIKVI